VQAGHLGSQEEKALLRTGEGQIEMGLAEGAERVHVHGDLLKKAWQVRRF
jgi:hypothetical protein